MAACSLQASQYLSGVSGHGTTLPVVQVGGVHVGKSKGYNHMHAANAIPSQHLTWRDFGLYLE